MIDHVNNGKLTLNQLINLMCENPCRIFGIKNKGFIKEGFDADLTIVDMKKEVTIKDEMIYAEQNNGAFINNQRIRVSKKNNLDECLFAVGKLKNEPSFTYRRSGCAALDIAYVASGRLDGYAQSNLNLWDIAAGIILIKEAGGMINDIDLNNIKNIKVLATSAEINTKFKEKLGNF